jgi:hypothetical protein
MRRAGVLTMTRDYEGAAAEAAAAAGVNPVYAAPHLVLGALADRQGKRPEAITHYARFLALAAQGDRNRPAIENRIAALRAASGG